ncbi:MAG TPA: general secretion pathway protein GspK [Burkholderiales bacterium]|nr:general secretion pathway protein GspK [Burkholderiales bacterium]
MRRDRQGGAVLLVALMVVAIATSLAAFAVQRQDTAVRQLETTRDYQQARWLVVGGVHWARTVLAEDARLGRTDHAREPWAIALQATEIEQATLTGALSDEQGLFNLANLSQDGLPSLRHVEAFRRLLRALGEPPTLADAIAAAQPMTEWDELHDVPGCDEKTVARLAQVATLLPRATPVNVNTAPPVVLAGLVEGLGLDEATVLANSLRVAPASSVSAFAQRLRPDLHVETTELVVSSGYFKVRGRVVLRKADVRVEALLQRHGRTLPEILWVRTS